MKGYVDRAIDCTKHKNLMCERCKELIKDPAYITVSGAVINTVGNTASIYTCPEQAFNYGQGIIMHTTCWIDTLKEHDVDVYDLEEVRKKYTEENKNGVG